MNHITENALVAGALLSIIIIPVVIITIKSKQKRIAALNQRVQSAANDNHLSITRSELIGNKIISWAKTQKILLFGSQEAIVLNDLNGAVKCYVLKNMNGNAVRSINLQIADHVNRLVCSVPFYEQFMDNELKIKQLEVQANDWAQLLNSEFQK